jgi:hypothetical protein
MQLLEWMMMMNEVRAEEIPDQKRITVDQGEIIQKVDRQINSRELQSIRNLKNKENKSNQNMNSKMMKKMVRAMVISEN